jgi:VanZ family protein
MPLAECFGYLLDIVWHTKFRDCYREPTEDADMADCSMRRWLAPLVLTLWLWGSVPFVRVISDWLRDHGLLRTCISAAGIMLILAFVFFVRRQTPPLSGLRRAMLTGLLGLTVLLMMTVVQRPEECVHFLQIGLLIFLVWRALPKTRGALGWAVLAGTLVGAVEEAIQIVVPGRIFDGRDIGMSAAAAVLTGVALWVIQGAAPLSITSPKTDH